jgi:hypothetical protein
MDSWQDKVGKKAPNFDKSARKIEQVHPAWDKYFREELKIDPDKINEMMGIHIHPSEVPYTLEAQFQQTIDKRRELLTSLVQQGHVIDATSAKASEEMRATQKLIKELVAAGGSRFVAPTLYVHTNTSPVSNMVLGMAADPTIPGVFQMSADGLLQAQKDPEVLRALLSHELTHQELGHHLAKNLGPRFRQPPTLREEYLADFGGMIKFGNAEKYRESMVRLYCPPGSGPLQYHTAFAPSTHGSPREIARYTTDIADLLHGAGAVNSHGAITLEKALPVFDAHVARMEKLVDPHAVRELARRASEILYAAAKKIHL